MNSAQLAARREMLVARARAQRLLLESQLTQFERPLRLFDAARQAGERMRHHVVLVAMAVSVLAAVGRLTLPAVKLWAGFRMLNKAGRWWGVARTLLSVGAGLAARSRPR